MRLHIITLTFALSAASMGCQQRPIGHFGDGAYYHARGHYRIRYGESPRGLLPSRWRLANYDHDEAGVPTREHDNDGEHDAAVLAGRGRAHIIRVPKVDLLYRERGSSAEIWVRTMVLPQSWDGDTTEQLLHAWARDVHIGRARVDPLERAAAIEQANLTHYGVAQVDGQPAHWIELDVTRGGVEQRVTVVAVRPLGHRYHWARRRSLPMLVLLGYTSAPDEHESVRLDFERLVQRVDIRR